MIKQPFETYDEKALAEVWKMEVEMSRRHDDPDDNRIAKPRDYRCHSDVALNRVITDDMRGIMSKFWHKGREAFVEWGDNEIAARCGIPQYSIDKILTRMVTLGALTWRRNRGNRFSQREEMIMYRLTAIGASVATADRHARQRFGGAMMPMQMLSIRKQMGILPRHMAARLNIEVSDLLAMEAGKKPISAEMAASVDNELKKHIQRTSDVHNIYVE